MNTWIASRGILIMFLYFSITTGMNIKTWAHMGLCAEAYTCLCSLCWALCTFRHICDICAFLCMFAPVSFDCVHYLCSDGWAPLLWQLSAAKGLERWHHWNGADLFECACVLFCGFISNESDEICVCCESERELDQITENLGTRLTLVPTRERVNVQKERGELQLKKQQWCLDERRVEWDVQ